MRYNEIRVKNHFMKLPLILIALGVVEIIILTLVGLYFYRL